MKRTSIAALTLLASFATLAGPGCSAEDPAETGNTTAGTAPINTGGTLSGTPTAGTSSTPTAGTPSGGGTPSTSAGAGGSSAGTATAGTAAGGTAAGGTGTAGSAGTASGGTASGGTGGTGTANPACPVKIDSAVMCTAVISCPASACGAFKLGAKDCKCDAATGPYTCTPCSYAGKTEPIVQKPATPLTACTADDMTLEKNTPTCTKGDRCASLTAKRFCACWTDPVKGSDVWDCDAIPAEWN